ncbi:MAG TPA: hypothetical protein VEW95_12895 [Candidatus Limnocylindrales bacterium]|nr:hypothetical protein [Candidatus Limnocylindrales bacterium]
MGFTIFKFLHILAMFAAVAGAVIPEVVLHWVASSGDVRAIRVFAGIAERVGKVLPVFFIGGVIFGLLAAATGSLDFFQPWLVAAYVVFAIAMVTGATTTGPWAARVAAAAEASGNDVLSPELELAIHDRRALIGSVVLMSAIVVMIFLMVFKPGR